MGWNSKMVWEKGGIGGKGPNPGTSCNSGGGGGTSGSIGGGGKGTGSRQPGKSTQQDGSGDDDDDPNKCRKTDGDGKPPRQPMVYKEPHKQGTTYPPVNRNLQDNPWSIRNHTSKVQHTHQLTETCQSSTSPVTIREQS